MDETSAGDYGLAEQMKGKKFEPKRSKRGGKRGGKRRGRRKGRR
jgi:hypothetical protein